MLRGVGRDAKYVAREVVERSEKKSRERFFTATVG